VKSDTELTRAFQTDGYAIVRQVLAADEVAELRALCSRELAGSGTEMLASQFLTLPELAAIPFRDEVVSALRELLGADYRLYPNFTARKDVYVPWHVDDAFAGPDREYVWEPGFAHAQAAIYLQDNEGSGGIDVIPGTHLISFDGYGKVPADFEIAARTIGASAYPRTVPTRAGDLLLWHPRLMHSSTGGPRPRTEDKFGIFFGCGRNHPYDNSRFLSQLVFNRVRMIDGVARTLPRLAEIVNLRWPDSFPEWMVKKAKDAGIEIATL
jgi:hypothetical protein